MSEAEPEEVRVAALGRARWMKSIVSYVQRIPREFYGQPDTREERRISNHLASALEVLGEELARHQRAAHRDATDLFIDVEGTPQDLHPVLRDEIYRIAGEALRNAFRHARAQRIEVEIRYDARQLRVRVRDDGIGINADVVSQPGCAGHFLRRMRECAKAIGGRLEVWSEHGAGTEVELTLPASVAYGAHRGRGFGLLTREVETNS